MKHFLRLIFTFFLILHFSSNVSAQGAMDHWVDSVFNSLSPQERIAQLLVVRANNPGKGYRDEVTRYIKKYNIGGLTFFRGDAIDQALVTNKWQDLAKTPLFISIDAEWGLGMRVNDAISFPFQMTLGAISDNALIYEMGRAVAIQCRRMGIHINFAPVADINSNPVNPIIGMRSFGEDKQQVSEKAIAYMKGMEEQRIIATGKHFPGHGDTDTDSHHTLPIINHDKSRLDSVELYPFRKLIDAGISGIMIAHLYIPELEKKPELASTLSPNIVNKLLRKQLGFDGLIITDALDMQGVTKYHKAGEIELKALEAGNDILLLPEDVPAAIRAIRKAISQKKIKQSLVDERCKKILRFKYQAGLDQEQFIDTTSLVKDLNASYYQSLNRRLYQASLTLIKNSRDIIPLKRLDTLNIASVSIGSTMPSPFQETLKKYAPVSCFQTSTVPDESEMIKLMSDLQVYNLLIIDFQNTNIFPWKNYGVSNEAIRLIGKMAGEKQVILNIAA
ncbi:MAG: glycoside hydrolase family 3 protein, partial [Bacteroidota bacterium]|nr:glycoside hydrolase family 3 protein [Bacteroidota bacterium]